MRGMLALRRIYRTVDPAIVHHVALQPSVLGVVASAGKRFASVYAITGLGHVFVSQGGNARVLRLGVRWLLRFGINRKRAIGLVQNPDDNDALARFKVKPSHTEIIPGSGIDADLFRPIPEPEGRVTVAFVGRMLQNKGVHTLIEAHRILRASNVVYDLLLAGAPDPANPTSIPQTELARWGREPGVTWLGHVADVSSIWRRAHIAVLPSRGGEGLPKSLLEAAASGRPLIATDVPGCREIVIHDKTGLLVPVDEPRALAEAMLRLIRSSAQRIRFGVAARRLVDERFSADLVGQGHRRALSTPARSLTMPIGEPTWMRAAALMVAAGLASAALILLLMPTFTRYALARPNERSSHRVPTPQGGGIAVIAAAFVMFMIGESLLPDGAAAVASMAPLGAAVVLLAAVGAVDDIFTVAELPRLALQAAAVGVVVLTLPVEFRVLPMLPLPIERAGEILTGLWFVNLTNFMDGIDWITVAETVPITASIFLFSLYGMVPLPAGLAALTLCGAMLGFAPFNRPVAQLFLGDVGSLPIGLILFFLMLQLAGRGHLAAALLLPLYYLADATITLLLRLARGENVIKAHRSHFYQLAAARGVSVMRIVGAVFGVNVALAVLAAASIAQPSPGAGVAAVALGAAMVAALLAVMQRGKT